MEAVSIDSEFDIDIVMHIMIYLFRFLSRVLSRLHELLDRFLYWKLRPDGQPGQLPIAA